MALQKEAEKSAMGTIFLAFVIMHLTNLAAMVMNMDVARTDM